MKYKELSGLFTLSQSVLVGIKNPQHIIKFLKNYGEKINEYDVVFCNSSFNKYENFSHCILDESSNRIILYLGD